DTARSGTTNVPHTGSRAICTACWSRDDGRGASRWRPRAPWRPSMNAAYVLEMSRRRIVRIRLTTMKRSILRSRFRCRARSARHPGMGGLQAVERAFGRLRFGRARRELDDLLPRLGRALQILLAERSDDSDVEQRLHVLGIE